MDNARVRIPPEARLRNWVFDRVLPGDILVEQNIHVGEEPWDAAVEEGLKNLARRTS